MAWGKTRPVREGVADQEKGQDRKAENEHAGRIRMGAVGGVPKRGGRIRGESGKWAKDRKHPERRRGRRSTGRRKSKEGAKKR